MTYVSVNWATDGSDNGLAPVWHQVIIWTNDGLLPIRPVGTKPQIAVKFESKCNNFQLRKNIEKVICNGNALITHYGPVTPCADIDLSQQWLR